MLLHTNITALTAVLTMGFEITNEGSLNKSGTSSATVLSSCSVIKLFAFHASSLFKASVFADGNAPPLHFLRLIRF